MQYSVFTGMCAGIVVSKMLRDRVEALEYYMVVIKMPTVFKAQLDRMILELTGG